MDKIESTKDLFRAATCLIWRPRPKVRRFPRLGDRLSKILNSVISAIEKVEIDFISRGLLDAAINRLGEIDREYPGQYLIKVSLAEAHILKGDPRSARKYLFLSANLNPSDFRYELLSWLVSDAGANSDSPNGHDAVVRKIEKRGTDSFHYLLGFSHYLGRYHRFDEQKSLLRLLAETQQSPECTRILIDACVQAELPDEDIATLKSKLA